MNHPRACIMGHPVAHSRSPMLHGYWLRTLGIDGAYELADVAPEKFDAFFRGLKANGFVGGNITIPHKEAAYRLVDRRERAADAIGAVNTVWYEGDALIGGNTDWLGIVGSLDDIHPGWDGSPGKVVVLGAGGSARASVFAFTERGFSVTDFYDEAQASIEIPAANKPTAQEAAEHYFKLARKARHGLKTISERLPEKTSVCHCSGGSARMPVPEVGRSVAAPVYSGLPANRIIGLACSRRICRRSASTSGASRRRMPMLRRMRGSLAYSRTM